MAISNQTVLKKMSNEIQEAMLQHGNEEKVKEHVRSVRLLADLLLDQDNQQRSVIEPTSQEVQAMMGGGQTNSTKAKPSTGEPTPDEIRAMMGGENPKSSQNERTKDEDDANGASIFDF
ncbi:YwdI family protein [Halobacillus locisalis]|uniref:YwdI family protein n=1 Tax=Halobacillus locisalis TaxID=220753 RepID=A0A838CTD6_9BACI|nr:YwdI family protein [Halobacillus locisalis]MBA2175204.1 YwdI family protein [Halobacillus locisalis]